ncbi:MAG: DMT family transporter, partial [Pseudomonadota bacterium]
MERHKPVREQSAHDYAISDHAHSVDKGSAGRNSVRKNTVRAGGNHAKGRQKLQGHLAALLFAALIAGSFSIGHMAAPLVEPEALNAARFVIATGVIFAIYCSTRRTLPPKPTAIWRFVILGALMATYFILMFVALRLASPVSTGAVFTLIPLMSAGFGWLFRADPSDHKAGHDQSRGGLAQEQP